MSDSEGNQAAANAETGDAPKVAGAGSAGVSAAPASRPSLARRLRWPLLIGGPVLLAIGILLFWLNGGRYIGTDDAYVQAARVDISSNVPGRIVEIDVHDNQRVAFGQQLFRLDSRAFDTAAAGASAQLAGARANLTAQQATVAERQATVAGQQADLKQAESNLTYQTRELARQKALAAAGVSSQQQLDAQAHAADAAKAQVEAAKAQVDTARQALAGAVAVLGGEKATAGANPAIRQAQAQLDQARLNQSYGAVQAPQAGTVTKVDQIQVGDYINAAQPLFSLVADRKWIEANFKEDQLGHMRVGQRATIKIDAFPNARITGHVESMSPGTGSSFALLPAENATGNWVKVVQRLPIRIAIDTLPKDVDLHAGLSAKISVDTEQQRHLFGTR